MKKIMFTGGGTLGHFTPNVALFEKLNKKYKCSYIGSKNGLEKEHAKKLMPYYEVETVKLERKLTFKNLLIPFKLLKGIKEAKKILKKEKPSLIFSKGGFVAVPVIVAAKKLKIPCITHESDFSLGLANKLIAKKCKYVCTSFKATSKNLKNGVYTGSAIRKQIFSGNKEIVIKRHKINPCLPTILITGGSLGAENLNKNLRKILPKLKEFNIVHLTGKGKVDKTINYNNYFQVEFASDIENYFALADLIITRGGSNTIFEILALKKPMLIIPLSSGRGDQILNAKDFEKNGYANVLFEEDITEKNFYESIKKTYDDRQKIMNNMKKTSLNGTEEISKLIEKVINEK